MEHPSLFARTRRTDPPTSHEAAALVNAKNQATTHGKLCFDEVERLPGQTSAEIAKRVGLERHEGARRLSDLYHAGLVEKRKARKCTVKHTKMLTWWPV